MKTMDDKIFGKLTERSEVDSDSTLDNIVVVSDYGKYSLIVYKNNGKYYLEEFGYYHRGEWVQMTPTHSQIETLERLVDSAEVNMILEKRREAEAMVNADMTDTYDFINNNFHFKY